MSEHAWPASDPGTNDTQPSNLTLQNERVARSMQPPEDHDACIEWSARALFAFDKIQNIFLADAYAARNPLKMDRVRMLVLSVGEDPRGL